MLPCSVFAPGKIHISGEHAVVYGHPALITAIDLGLNINFTPQAKNISIRFDQYTQENSTQNLLALFAEANDLKKMGQQKKDFSGLFQLLKSEPYNFLKIMLGKLLSEMPIPGLALDIQSSLPLGAGLGSSAAFAVGLAAGWKNILGESPSIEQINQTAFELETLINGQVSGGDNSAISYGGLISFQKVEGRNFRINSIKLENNNFKNFVLLNTGKPHSTTGELVAKVSELPETKRDLIFTEISKNQEDLILALQRSEDHKIIDALNNNQSCLQELGVSTSLIDQINLDLSRLGGGSKLCGAGGGGVVLCYHQDPKIIYSYCQKNNLDLIPATLNGLGVQVNK